MKMNYGDFRQFVVGSFVRLKPFSDAPNGCCGQVLPIPGGNNENMKVIMVNTTNGLIRLTWEQAKTLFVVEFPDRHLFNHEDRALLYTRHVVKQFGKGPNEVNSGIYDPVSWMTPHKRRERQLSFEAALQGARYEITLQTWNSMNNAVYPTVPDAVEALTRRQISVAVSPEYAVVASTTQGHTYPVIHFDHVIGILKYPRPMRRGVPYIKPVSEDFEQDCKDFTTSELKGRA